MVGGVLGFALFYLVIFIGHINYHVRRNWNKRLMNQVNKIIICALSVVVLVFPFTTYAQNDAPSPFPKTLFGVKLGGIYNIGSSDENHLEVGTFPVKTAKGMKQFLGYGINYYFQPLKEYEAFKYIEEQKKPNDKGIRTSFRLYLFPIFPKDTSLSLIELTGDMFTYEVARIEWSEDEIKKDNAYYWAASFCKSLQVDLGKQPKVTDFFENKSYKCLFKENDKELSASSYHGKKYFTLSYIQSVMDKKDEATEKIGRKWRMKDIKPYE